MSVPFPIGKLGVAPAGCMSDVTEMECGRSEIEELIKEVSGGVSGIFQEDQTLLLTLRGFESLGLSYLKRWSEGLPSYLPRAASLYCMPFGLPAELC